MRTALPQKAASSLVRQRALGEQRGDVRWRLCCVKEIPDSTGACTRQGRTLCTDAPLRPGGWMMPCGCVLCNACLQLRVSTIPGHPSSDFLPTKRYVRSGTGLPLG